ncbi:glycosyltransferase family 4 protein [Dyadobacter sp. CY345]|uniref:glycosyltransferase family 4 protein n=1 Tax=Dyadobacter sp. CY345 TaxID=2909335 RepID=UPI001F2CFCA2|nr:glycosyltransferase family 4 protein [Dyadobacter sp. CY345]MCF2447050.1 glycosyltransferase family 4 protein [Dyadobacter sp. CY345]
MKIIVSQLNARHRYIIPIILDKNDLLERLYTNTCKYSFLGTLSSLFIRMGIKIPILFRLSNRDPKIDKSKVYSSDYPLLRSLVSKKNDDLLQNEIMYQSLNETFSKNGLGSADCLYTMFFENLKFAEFCKNNNLKVVIDIYENPNAFRELISEITEHPEYSIFSNLIKSYRAKAAFREKYVEKMLLIADYYTIPSNYVKNSLSSYLNYDSKKANIIPYPSSIQVKNYNYRPKKHKLIWVGNDPVRKGLIYCAKAAKILKLKYPDIEFVVIGSVDDRLAKSDFFSDLKFVGVLGKKDLIEEFETAEAYIFPTLFEGLAGTVIEAASCGCPIITTENSGMDLENFPAIYIPVKDVLAIVDSVTSLFEDSEVRDRLSKSAFLYSQSLSQEKYELKLIDFFKSIDVI